jgi:hypothetical protein
MAMDGATATRRRGTALARRQWTESTTAMGGDGRCNGELMMMDGAALRRWAARRRQWPARDSAMVTQVFETLKPVLLCLACV